MRCRSGVAAPEDGRSPAVCGCAALHSSCCGLFDLGRAQELRTASGHLRSFCAAGAVTKAAGESGRDRVEGFARPAQYLKTAPFSWVQSQTRSWRQVARKELILVGTASAK